MLAIIGDRLDVLDMMATIRAQARNIVQMDGRENAIVGKLIN